MSAYTVIFLTCDFKRCGTEIDFPDDGAKTLTEAREKARSWHDWTGTARKDWCPMHPDGAPKK